MENNLENDLRFMLNSLKLAACVKNIKVEKDFIDFFLPTDGRVSDIKFPYPIADTYHWEWDKKSRDNYIGFDRFTIQPHYQNAIPDSLMNEYKNNMDVRYIGGFHRLISKQDFIGTIYANDINQYVIESIERNDLTRLLSPNVQDVVNSRLARRRKMAQALAESRQDKSG